ncbi:MAG TPA: 30S ribosomal protein S8 [Candidatus Binatia bacterium]|nr:30S ribosomal protein S8 [Candidatus Binatia bacterium]
MATDPIADMITRIRNAIAAGKDETSLPHSMTKERVAKILARSGFLEDVKQSKDELGHKNLDVVINLPGTNSTITEISRLSKPGRRWYVKSKEIPLVKRGRGIVIISTSAGIMTGEEARAKRLGGELICKVY